MSGVPRSGLYKISFRPRTLVANGNKQLIAAKVLASAPASNCRILPATRRSVQANIQAAAMVCIREPRWRQNRFNVACRDLEDRTCFSLHKAC